MLLDLALQQFALRKLIEHGFTPIITPDLARNSVLEGIGFSPRGEETQIYSVEDSDLSLIGTAEITLGGMHADELLDEPALPIKYVGLSHCFRTEAGAAGRASKGLYRVHQFTKVEMFAFTTPEASGAMHQTLLAIEEDIFQSLGIPYRVLDICSGDLGGPAYRKFDLEAWMPGRGDGGEYGEVTSTSDCTDYQARRLGIRYRPGGQKGTRFVHTLNGTAVAISRALIVDPGELPAGRRPGRRPRGAEALHGQGRHRPGHHGESADGRCPPLRRVASPDDSARTTNP